MSLPGKEKGSQNALVRRAAGKTRIVVTSLRPKLIYDWALRVSPELAALCGVSGQWEGPSASEGRSFRDFDRMLRRGKHVVGKVSPSCQASRSDACGVGVSIVRTFYGSAGSSACERYSWLAYLVNPFRLVSSLTDAEKLEKQANVLDETSVFEGRLEFFSSLLGVCPSNSQNRRKSLFCGHTSTEK